MSFVNKQYFAKDFASMYIQSFSKNVIISDAQFPIKYFVAVTWSRFIILYWIMN